MAAIGPTAHYTGRVWARNGLGHPELDTVAGRALHAAAEPTMALSRLLGGPTLEDFLLARHLVLDALLHEAIASGRVTQVLELACGMSPRGWRFTERHPGLAYVEADLPDMARAKREALRRIGRPARHRVAELDALAPEGPLSLEAVAARQLDDREGLAVVTEGLLSYLPRDGVTALWGRVAALLGAREHGVYLSDLHVGADAPTALGRAFELALSAFVRTRVRVHFATTADAQRALLDAGFGSARVLGAGEHPAAAGRRGASLVRVLHARP